MKDKIRKLIGKNFQSHVDTEIEFLDGFNAIIGPTGSGKSAALRLIEWILYNRTPDSNFITMGEETCEGTIVMASGKRVTRGRNKKENYYILAKADGEQLQPLTGFGDSPVEEVMNFHGIKPIHIGKNDVFITFHGQHDQPFFLMESPADKAKVIGSLAKTDVVDVTISELAADTKREQTRLSDIKRQIKEQDDLIESFASLDDMTKDLEIAQNKISLIQQNQQAITRADDSSDNLSDLVFKYKKAKRVIGRKDSIERAFDLLEKVKVKAQRINMVETTWDDMWDNVRKMKRCNGVIEKIAEKDLLEVTNAVNFISQNQELVTKLSTLHKDLQGNIDKLEHCMKTINLGPDIGKLQDIIAVLSQEQQNLKTFMATSSKLSGEIERFKKGIVIISSRKEEVASIQEEIRLEIEQNPICPICKSDLRERKEAVLNA
jgi:exonuclease SbcC